MGFRFRKSKKIGPFRITLSKSGISTSVGVKGFRVTKTASGRIRTTASIPGTGISYVKETGRKRNASTPTRNASAYPYQKETVWPTGMRYRGPLSPVPDGYDELTEQAARFVIARGVATAAELQREFQIGYTRAVHMMSELEALGVIGPGCAARSVLLSPAREEPPSFSEDDAQNNMPPVFENPEDGTSHVFRLIAIGSVVGIILTIIINLVHGL